MDTGLNAQLHEMISMYPAVWAGSDDPADPKGTATFMVEGEKFVLEPGSFDQFRSLGRMHDLANIQGKAFAASDLNYVVMRALHHRIAEIAPDALDIPSP